MNKAVPNLATETKKDQVSNKMYRVSVLIPIVHSNIKNITMNTCICTCNFFYDFQHYRLDQNGIAKLPILYCNFKFVDIK